MDEHECRQPLAFGMASVFQTVHDVGLISLESVKALAIAKTRIRSSSLNNFTLILRIDEHLLKHFGSPIT